MDGGTREGVCHQRPGGDQFWLDDCPAMMPLEGVAREMTLAM